MNQKQDFLGHHDTFIVVGCFRFGSTALAHMIDDWIRANWELHMRPTLFLNEFLSLHHYANKTEKGFGMGYMTEDYLPFGDSGKSLNLTMVRPAPPHVMRNKLAWINRMKASHKIIIKLDPSDWDKHGAELLEKHLLNDPRSYKLGLCRQDVGNAMISFCIGIDFGIWNMNRDEYDQELTKTIVKKNCRLENMQNFCNTVLSHLNWLLYSADMLNTMVWYDQLDDLQIAQIEFSKIKHDKGIIKNPMSHADRCRLYYNNGEDVIQLANRFQAQMDPLLLEVRKATQHLVSG